MDDKLAGLARHTIIVADTGDIAQIKAVRAEDCTTNPSLILKAASKPEYAALMQDAVDYAVAREHDAGARLELALDKLAVNFGTELSRIVPGYVSTEVDARLSFDAAATVRRAERLIALYREAGVDPKRILIKIAATWEGIQAAAELEKEGIHCNLTLLFGLHQAIACAEAGVTLISPFVGRILDWYKKDTGRDSYPASEDPGVLSVTQIFTYYKKFGYKTEVMGASFRNMGEITELAGCDLLTIAPSLLAELKATEGELPRKLDPAKAATASVEKIAVDKATFDRMHAADRMATEKLAEGIAGFTKALETLEQLLAARLKVLEG